MKLQLKNRGFNFVNISCLAEHFLFTYINQTKTNVINIFFMKRRAEIRRSNKKE